MRRLEGRALVVAGAGGIGTEVARRFAAEGAAVLLGDVDLASAEAGAHVIEGEGGRVLATRPDGSDEQSIGAAVTMASREFGGLDGFHANFASFADGTGGEDVLTLPMAVYDEMMDVNARGYFLCTRHAVPAMLERGGGAMLYTSSGAAYAGEPVRVSYAMSKAAVHALARHVAKRFGGQNIRANVIAPGLIAHAKFKAILTKDMTDQLRRNTPLQSRLGEPEDIAAMAALLMSDEGGYITGQVINVDGGAVMRA
jgi:NAD(P)-dependent dehydrogenase (short-subunit alcohol dehydrogenase family)